RRGPSVHLPFAASGARSSVEERRPSKPLVGGSNPPGRIPEPKKRGLSPPSVLGQDWVRFGRTRLERSGVSDWLDATASLACFMRPCETFRSEQHKERKMKRLAVVSIAVISAAAIAVAAPAAADYRIPLFGCSVGVPGANLVPADAPLYFDSGWTTGTRGLVQNAINDARFTFTDTRNGVTTVRYPQWGPIVQDNFIFTGSWTANW